MCTRPMKFWRSDVINPKTGKFLGFITGYDVKKVTPEDFNKRCVELEHPSHCFNLQPVEVPCGKCPECVRAYKYSWVGRCLAEAETTPYSYFITLTYDDAHLLASPQKKEIQNFINRLRKFIKCRYLAVGEHGNLSDRSHYHLILFCQNPIEDLAVLKRGEPPLFTSELLSRCWDYKGYVSVGQANAQTFAYTLGYILTKEKKTAFKMQSQGLGSVFFSSLKDKYFLGDGKGNAITVTLPRFLKEKYGIRFEYDPEMQALKWNNKVYSTKLKEEEARDLLDYLGSSKLVKH